MELGLLLLLWDEKGVSKKRMRQLWNSLHSTLLLKFVSPLQLRWCFNITNSEYFAPDMYNLHTLLVTLSAYLECWCYYLLIRITWWLGSPVVNWFADDKLHWNLPGPEIRRYDECDRCIICCSIVVQSLYNRCTIVVQLLNNRCIICCSIFWQQR